MVMRVYLYLLYAVTRRHPAWTRDSVYMCHEMYIGFAASGLILNLNKPGGIIGDS
jgi:hypothetical protein